MENFRVLIVDDELDFLETILIRLQRRNVDAVGVSSGKMAIEMIEREHFDVAILDVRMPGIDGFETLREIKKRRPFMEVIMLTGHGSVESGIQGMQMGAFDYVLKPVKIDDLLDRVRKAFERKAIHEKKSGR
ncbi:Response regulator receiver protein [uncultured Desulfobacterium sp.]|uniref:Response regulator receiver protein n=1 Tax=uncultured Desulfobacterium sp. TaxID=201089 RepID=A0A445MY92_9BACT|nr:Response regulator receiver protein [uncultured Desulfobacterium sp.]